MKVGTNSLHGKIWLEVSNTSTGYFGEIPPNSGHGNKFYSLLMMDSHLKNWFICFNESSLKMMEDAFYFTLKIIFFLKIFKLLS